jgi:hypothetical protein
MINMKYRLKVAVGVNETSLGNVFIPSLSSTNEAKSEIFNHNLDGRRCLINEDVSVSWLE